MYELYSLADDVSECELSGALPALSIAFHNASVWMVNREPG
jgi:hypothetical protein